MNEKILINGNYFSSLLFDINQAIKCIDLETYIFANDSVGKAIAKALCQAAKRGVKIRVLVDGFGTPNWGDSLTLSMNEAGIVSRVFHPLPWIVAHLNHTSRIPGRFVKKILFLISKINHRNHRKVCIIDNRIVYIGSANLTEGFRVTPETKFIFRDTTVRLVDVPSKDQGILQDAFEKSWHGKFSTYYRYHLFKKRPKSSIFRLNDSWRLRSQLYVSLLKKIKQSTKRIWIANAYFVPDRLLLLALISAAKRGIDVKILLTNRYELMVVSLVTRSFYATLLEAGASIFEYYPSIMHAKTLIIDDWYCIGSTNLNTRSRYYDLEIDVVLTKDTAKTALENQFQIDLNASAKVNTASVKKRSFFEKALGKGLLLLTYWF